MHCAHPRALILNIEGAMDRSCLQNTSGTKYKVCTLYRYKKIFSVSNNIPLRWLSTASSTGHFDYSYAHIYGLFIEDFVVEIHHRRRHFFFELFF